MEMEASMDFSMDGALYTYHSYFSITKPSKQWRGEQIWQGLEWGDKEEMGLRPFPEAVISARSSVAVLCSMQHDLLQCPSRRSSLGPAALRRWNEHVCTSAPLSWGKLD